jgi:hypothetical protein
MPEYKLVVSGYGKSVAIGTIDKDLHFFWKMNNPVVTKTQLFREAYTVENANIKIEDSGSPFYIPIWKDNNDILLESGVYSDAMHIFVYDQFDSPIWYSDQVDYNVTSVFDQETSLELGYYLKTWRERKGEFGIATFSDKEFDPTALTFQAVKINNQDIITVFKYLDQDLEINLSEFGGITLDYEFFRIK